jgi:SAM-dependent methyltransferase
MLAGMVNSASSSPEQCWKAQSGEAWVRYQRELDAQLGPLGRALIERVLPEPGERVVDVGSGAGQTLLELAERVGPAGRVLGVDVSEPMVERARQRVAAAGLSNVDVVLGDAQEHAFDGSFELVFSRLGVMFFRDPVAAFRNLRSALHPGGRLGFVCFQSRADNEWAEVLLAAVAQVCGREVVPPLLEPDRPGPFFFADPERIRSVLEQAGFGALQLEPDQRALHFGGALTLDQAVDYALNVGPAARVIAEADPALRPRFGEALASAIQPFVSPSGVWLGSAHWLVTARHT